MQRISIPIGSGLAVLRRAVRASMGLLLALLCTLPNTEIGRADSTFVYAVQLSASVQVSPPQITLAWEPDPYGANSYTIYRKTKTDTAWGQPLATLPGEALGYSDSAVAVGSSYEYRVVKVATLGYTGYGYLYSGIQAPMVDQRGTLVLVVASESTSSLGNEIAQLEQDLIGDGWRVIRHDVSSNDTPTTVRSVIMLDYYQDPTNVDAVFLLGHVPILQSGYMNYDGHGPRPMPADAFYGEMNNDWPTDPTNSPSYLPSDAALMVGRVDLANMPGNGAAVPWPDEQELLRNYLHKDHAWRQGLIPVMRQALMGNRRGDEGGLAVAASGYRAFEPLVGAGRTVEANIADVAPTGQRWISMLAQDGYLWAYGCGGGQDAAIGYLGTHDVDYEVWSTDVVGQDAEAVFVMVFGSHLGNWDHTDNIMRSVLATPTMGLACCMSGEPHWFFHHFGLGETLGYSARLSLNNSTLYQNQTNPFTRAAYIALMGDPTLRMEPVPPAANLSAIADTAGVHLSWGSSPAPVAGYKVYRSTSQGGPFSALVDTLVSATNFTDVTASPNNYVYMVRAVALQLNPSGSYFNPSEGIFAEAAMTAPTVPVQIHALLSSNGLTLSWNAQAGMSYHVYAQAVLVNTNWVDISGPLMATSTNLVWTDVSVLSQQQRFYRIGSP